MKKYNILIILSILFCVIIAISGVCKDAEYPFYKGKTIYAGVLGSAGGGQDFYGRLTAEYLAKELGATIVCENWVGSGGINVANALARSKSDDGLNLLQINVPGSLYAQLTGTPGVEYDLVKDFIWIGGPAADAAVYYAGVKSGITKWEDIVNRKKHFTMGYSGMGSDDYYYANILADVFNLDIVHVPGFDGQGTLKIAVVRGEVDMSSSSFGTIANLVRDGEVIPIAVLSDKRLEEIPDVPSLLEYDINDSLKSKLLYTLDLLSFGRATWAVPKNTPDEAVQELRRAWNVIIDNPEMIAIAEKADRPIVKVYGEHVQNNLPLVVQTKEFNEIIELIKSLTKD